MSEPTNSEMKHFRASPEMAGALARAAQREGVSQSEIIRRALAGRLGVKDGPDPAPFDPFERLAAAARGELQAQRDVANEAIRRAHSGEEAVHLEKTLVEGLVFARLAAARGQVADQGLVISMLVMLAKAVGEENAPDEFAEAIARTEWIANRGGAEGEGAATALVAAAGDLTAEMMADAQHFCTRIRDEQGGR